MTKGTHVFTAAGRYDRTWTGKAKANLVRQVPLIATTFPDVADYYPATVNVRFAPMLVMAAADHRTPPLKWKAAGEDGETGEVFDFVRVTLAIGGRPPVRALWVVSHWSLHRLDPHKHEFLVERFVDGLVDGEPVTMACDRPFVELPYSKAEHGDVSREARTIVVL